MRIVGYTDRMSVASGELLRVMVSSEAPSVAANLVRLIHGDPHPDGPGYREQVVASSLDGTYAAQFQRIVTGSYVVVPHIEDLNTADALTVHVLAYPTLLGSRSRTLLSKRDPRGGGWELALDSNGRVVFTVTTREGGTRRLVTRRSLRLRRWYGIAARIDATRGIVSVDVATVGDYNVESSSLTPSPEQVSERIQPAPMTCTTSNLIIAGRLSERHDADQTVVGETFDGKLSNPTLFQRTLSDDELMRLNTGCSPHDIAGVVASWDFGRAIDSRDVLDTGGRGIHGRTVNMPSRGVPGPWWQHGVTNYAAAPKEFAAIHFHEDDLDDAGWKSTIEWSVPDDMPSGVYGIRLRDDAGGEDCIPFFIRASINAAKSNVVFLAPVFSYLAYANEHMLEDERVVRFLERYVGRLKYPSQPQDKYIVENQLHSLYDRHHDGSGVFYSSWLRPLMNFRPNYVSQQRRMGKGAARQFNGDLHIIDWLHANEISYDVVTDVDLHREGADLLRPYRVVITGSHPEYSTREVLCSLRSYADSGGRLMYLGGNGFYWITGFDRDECHTVEVRRCGAATRVWETEPGAWHLTTTGELGGLWRTRGLAPQSLIGVGFTAQGQGEGRPYSRQRDSFDPRAKFIFANIGDDELIGDFPNLVSAHGAAGVEVDRADMALGTPDHALVLATASDFSDGFQHAIEEVLFSDSAQNGSVCPYVRSDMVFFECPGGGAIFSVGSIAWSGGLSHNNYDNNVSKITGNVLQRFMEREPFELPH